MQKLDCPIELGNDRRGERERLPPRLHRGQAASESRLALRTDVRSLKRTRCLATLDITQIHPHPPLKKGGDNKDNVLSVMHQ